MELNRYGVIKLPLLTPQVSIIWKAQRDIFDNLEKLNRISEGSIDRELDRLKNIDAGNVHTTKVLRVMGRVSIETSLRPTMRAGLLVSMYGATEHILKQTRDLVGTHQSKKNRQFDRGQIGNPRGDILRHLAWLERRLETKMLRKEKLEIELLRLVRNVLVHSNGLLKSRDLKRLMSFRRKILKLRSRDEKFGLVDTLKVLRDQQAFRVCPGARFVEQSEYALQLPIHRLLRATDTFLRKIDGEKMTS